jgi:hypothetical protein
MLYISSAAYAWQEPMAVSPLFKATLMPAGSGIVKRGSQPMTVKHPVPATRAIPARSNPFFLISIN